MRSTRSFVYAIARAMGDVQAARKGWHEIIMRLARKAALRQVGRRVDKIK